MSPFLIAVTGGPSGGKTTLIEILKKELIEQVRVIPESASILYRGGFPRQPSELGRVHAQRSIFYVQKELENWGLAEAESHQSKIKAIVCDRGSFDSLAYWPRTETEFFEGLGTTREFELQRYRYVLHLDSAGQESFDTSNPVRIENSQEAQILNERVKKAWTGHPMRIVVPNHLNFLEKITRAKEIVEQMIVGQPFDNFS